MTKEYKSADIRNVALIGHGQTGKSTLLDAMLFAGGQIDRMGNAASGTLVSDFDDDEKDRKISLKSAMGFVELDGVKINIIDTPGTADFVGETRAALQAVECAIMVVDSVDGVQIETEKAWRYLTEKKIPCIFFVNKMDKERANFNQVLDSLKNILGARVAPLSIPFGEGDKFSGVINLIDMKLYSPKGDGKDVTTADVPAEAAKDAEEKKSALVELAAEADDALIEKFLEGGELTTEEIASGMGLLLSQAKLCPVTCGASEKVNGIKTLLRIIKSFAPAPATGKEYTGYNPNNNEEKAVKMAPDGPLAAVVWKTYIDQYAGRFNYLKVISGELNHDVEAFNPAKRDKERITKLFSMIGNKQVEVQKLCAGDIGVVVKLTKTTTKDTLCDPKADPIVLPIVDLPDPVFSFAVVSTNKGDEDKIGQFFARVTDENPTITYKYNAETREAVLSGMGELQLSIILNQLKEKNKIEVLTREPRVAYRETITKMAETAYKHKKQTGGHGQYGDVSIRIKPRGRGEGYEFIDSIVGGVVPKQYIPGVQKGIFEAMDEGVLGKFPVVDMSAELYFGSYHDVDSSEMSFKIAARNCIKKAMEMAGPQLLEPIMEVSVFVDKEFMGDILSDVTSRRGRVLGMDSSEGSGSISVIKATVPLAEMLSYPIDLRAMTSGKATFEMKFSHYDPIGGRDAEKILEERRKQLEEEANK
ncbi:MAG TPA: elongation factor G [Spirochaetota bacterium]|nr:elongation factor G [Spirochaetota bacterium]